MSKLFDRLDTAIARVDLAARRLGKCKERVLSDEVRSELIDQLIDDALHLRHPRTMLIDVMKNGCVGYNYFTDLVLCEVLRDDILERGVDDDDNVCPPITDKIVKSLQQFEFQLMKED